MLCILYHLRNRTLLTRCSVKHVITDDIDILVVNGTKMLIYLNSASSATGYFLGNIRSNLRTLDTCSPDYGSCYMLGNLVIFLQLDEVLSNTYNAGIHYHIYAHLAKTLIYLVG